MQEDRGISEEKERGRGRNEMNERDDDARTERVRCYEGSLESLVGPRVRR